MSGYFDRNCCICYSLKFHEYNAKVTVAMATDSLVLGADNKYYDFMLACSLSYRSINFECSWNFSGKKISKTDVFTFFETQGGYSYVIKNIGITHVIKAYSKIKAIHYDLYIAISFYMS